MLQLLDTMKFIKENGCLEVTSTLSFDKKLEPTKDGLYSPDIFGSNKQDQFTKFGFINLGTRVLHPLIYKNIGSISGIFKKVLTKVIKVNIVSGILVEDESGWTGIKDLYNNWDKISFKKYDEKNSKVKSLIEFLINTKKEMIFEDKILVIPINFRPAMLKNGLMVEDEISGLYKTLMNMNDKYGTSNLSTEFMQSLMQLTDKTSIIQERVNKLYDYFINFLEKKDGLFRTSLIGKRQNNTARLVANAQPTIPMNCIVLPWHACLNIFDLPIIGMINNDPYEKKYTEELGLKDLSPDDIADLFSFIYHNVDIYSKNNPALVIKWQDLLLDTFNFHSTLRCFVKRDPAWDKGSYHLLSPVINTDNEFACIINSALYNPLGGDSFFSNFTVNKSNTSLLTKDESGELYLPNDKKVYHIKSMHKIYDAANLQ